LEDKTVATEKFDVLNRWTGAVHKRQGSPRSVRAVRARVVHTAAQKRRLDIFVTEVVARALGWAEGGIVRAEFSSDERHFFVRLTPAHQGVRATRPSKKSGTLRIAISGAPLTTGLCAKVREVSFRFDDGQLIADLPLEWALEYCAATGIELVSGAEA
jgi:hypothetical protein